MTFYAYLEFYLTNILHVRHLRCLQSIHLAQYGLEVRYLLKPQVTQRFWGTVCRHFNTGQLWHIYQQLLGLYLTSWVSHPSAALKQWGSLSVFQSFSVSSIKFVRYSDFQRKMQRRHKQHMTLYPRCSRVLLIWLNVYFYISVCICKSLIPAMFERSSLSYPILLQHACTHRIKAPQ